MLAQKHCDYWRRTYTTQLRTIKQCFKTKGLNTWIETAGTNDIKTHIDWVCFSPKKFKKPVNSFTK